MERNLSRAYLELNTHTQLEASVFSFKTEQVDWFNYKVSNILTGKVHMYIMEWKKSLTTFTYFDSFQQADIPDHDTLFNII